MRSIDIKNVSILVARIDHTSVKLLSNELLHRLVALLLLVYLEERSLTYE